MMPANDSTTPVTVTTRKRSLYISATPKGTKSGMVAIMIEAKLPGSKLTPDVSRMLYINGSKNDNIKNIPQSPLRMRSKRWVRAKNGIIKRDAISKRPVTMIEVVMCGSLRKSPLVNIKDAPQKKEEASKIMRALRNEKFFLR